MCSSSASTCKPRGLPPSFAERGEIAGFRVMLLRLDPRTRSSMKVSNGTWAVVRYSAPVSTLIVAEGEGISPSFSPLVRCLA